MMPLPRFVLLCICAVVIVSCSKDYKTVEREAITAFDVPVFADMNNVQDMDMISVLPAGTLVYVTDEKDSVDGIQCVKIIWSDSTAWAEKDKLLLHGKMGIVLADSAKAREIRTYGSPDLTGSDTRIGGSWMIAAVAPTGKGSTQVLFWAEAPYSVYVPDSAVLVDPLEVVLARKYQSQEGLPEQYLVLGEEKFKDLKLTKWISESGSYDGIVEEGDYEGDEELGGEYDETGMAEFETEENWKSNDGKPLDKSEYPGTISKYIIFDNDTEVKAEGYTIAGGYAYDKNDQSNDIVVKGVRFEFVPNKNCNITFTKQAWDGIHNLKLDQEDDTISAEAGKPYAVMIMNGESLDILCLSTKVIFSTDKAFATLVIHAECGD